MDSKRMTNGRFERFRSERGIALIHVGLLLFVFMGFSMFVTDLGALWLARGQAQNAADAGALAGAVARGFDDVGDPPAVNGIVYQSAQAAVANHGVVGAVPTASVTMTCPPYATAGVRCVRVDVFRDGTNGSATLPTFFGNVFGITSQRIKATATAQVANANATNCMRPWAIADKWFEQVLPANEFNHWTKAGNNLVELNPHDVYTPPSNTPNGSPGTGYTLEPYAGHPQGDLGTEVILKVGSSGAAVTSGWFLPLDLPDGNGGYPTGGNVYRYNISHCTGKPVGLGDLIPTESGNMVGPTNQGFDDLKALDGNATFNTSTKQVENSCAPGCAPFSPRIVPITVFNMDEYQRRNVLNNWNQADPVACPTGGSCVQVVNILGFFVDRMSGNDVVGYLIMYPGEFVTGKPNISNSASFSKIIQLIQ